ncbi:MAG: SDR family oxidoreductase [Deltaproteobacteria bacterium]|jgi:short-subunit dehydrogenase|nr:SDR family oxidoreductase [Deltaproteobacteria bacterium]
MPTLLVVGATSDIARATALVFGENGWDLILAGRDMERITTIAADLSFMLDREVSFHHYDVLNEPERLNLWDSLQKKPDAVLLAVGLLGDQEQARFDPELATKIMTVNFTGLVSLITQVANFFEARGSGSLIGISSVAGDRGRGSNFTYGAAKAGLTAYLSGLRNKLFSKGVHVLTVKPGFVKTAMTKDMKLPFLLTATPEQVAKSIYKGVKNRKNVIYTRWYWKWIMFIVKAIPEFIFKRLSM